MNPFHRKELFITRDLTELNRLLGLLASGGIDCVTRTNSLGGLGRSHGIPGISAEHAYEYRVYVHRDDYERARYAIGR